MYFEWMQKWVFNLLGVIDYDKSITDLHESSKLDFAYIILVVLAAFIATLGLITNSAAVIIGAMIISPIMAPIMLSGASMAIKDKTKAKTALKSVFIGIVIAVACGAFTVYVSPIKENTAEILARTTPNILDLFIAFFCGVAGALSVVSEKISKGVVGVAISVALMPPLCVGAFGLATAQASIALGGFWMFFLNMAAIFAATFAVLSLFGYSAYFEAKRQKHFGVRWVVSFGFLALISIPLVLSLKDAVELKNERDMIKMELEKSFNIESISILQNQTIEKTEEGYKVGAFLDTVKSFSRAYLKSVEKNISTKLGAHIELFAVQRGALSIKDSNATQFTLFDVTRPKIETKVSLKDKKLLEIAPLMRFAKIDSYEYDSASNLLTIKQSGIKAEESLRLQKALLEEGVKSVVVFEKEETLFDEETEVMFDADVVRRLIRIADFASDNSLKLDIVVFAKANNAQKLEKNLLDIFGRNKSQIRIENSKIQKVRISAKELNATNQ